MAMNQQQLARAIDVGRSSTLNCFEDIAGIAAEIKRNLRLLKASLRENYVSIVEKLKTYEESYRQFIEESRPGPFREFLGEADLHYVDLAACLSRNSHAINLLQDQLSRTGAMIPSEQHHELLECMLGVFGIEPQAADMRIAS